MKRLLIILLACASHALAGPTVRVTIDAEGEGSGLILQAYTACLRNTPGVQVVPLGRPANAQIQIISVILTNQAAGKTGYAWASATFDLATRVLLDGPNEYVAALTKASCNRQRRTFRFSTVMFSFLYAINQSTKQS